jgi:sialic acid synthase SpsE/mannose-6-phosphate isomerase-like protein (cupin superfamily)
MENGFDFRDLFVLDLANNHQGSVEHGLKVIREHASVVQKHGVRAAVKFQFRDLDTFIHPHHVVESSNRHIPRFLSTRLSLQEYQRLFEEVKRQGLYTMCTPFDEKSAHLVGEMKFDLIKVASCSAKDWPLIEAVAETNLPVIFSSGGLTIDDIDNLVVFGEHRALDLALMHCVSIYPTPPEVCHLQNIAMLRRRYPTTCIGWSTHEDPETVAAVQMAVAYGAVLFERHIGLPARDVQPNAYSAVPEQTDRWLGAWKLAQLLAGSHERQEAQDAEIQAIKSLQRGVFAKRPLKAGEQLEHEDIFFAMPMQEGQLDSGSFCGGIVVQHDIERDAPLMRDNLILPEPSDGQKLKRHVHHVKAILNIAGIKLGPEFYVEYSHHYGIPNFARTGCVLIDCVNRTYCKKILVQLPGQSHPYHFHRLKEETFQVLWGDMYLNIDGEERLLRPGDTAVVLPGAWHKFRTDKGCVAEEISTTHHNNDSVYKDAAINKLPREERKTIVKHWGRFEIT